MLPLEKPEKSGKDASYPGRRSFAKLLDWHLKRGTHPTIHPDRTGSRWTNKGFAQAVGGVDERSVRNWRRGANRPIDLVSIERELFGEAEAHEHWRIDLRAAYDGSSEADGMASLPGLTANFVGRQRDVETVINALRASTTAGAILIQGGPGIGKTELSKAIAARPEIIRRFGAVNRWFVPLETATTAAAMKDAIVRSVGGNPTQGFKSALTVLANTRGLLILDNLETPWEPKDQRQETEATLAALARLPNLVLLVSFRGRERVDGPEWTLVHPVAQLDDPSSEELFCRISGSTFSSDPILPMFTKALGGIPLAIALVAARAFGHESLSELWREWERIGTALAEHPDFSRGRLTSLPHSIELSLKSTRVREFALNLFRLLGQAPAGLAVEDRDVLLKETGFNAEESLRHSGLAVKREGRLDLLPPIRNHAARHHIPNELDQLAWAKHYLDLTSRLGGTIGKSVGLGAVSRLRREFPNIEVAIRIVLKADRCDLAMNAFIGIANLTTITSLPTPILDEMADACRAAGDTRGEANCLQCLGHIARNRSDHDAARKAQEKALSLYRRMGDLLGEANCTMGLGEISLDRSDDSAAQMAFERALPLFREVGSILSEANCIKNLGYIALRRSDLNSAWAACEQALPLYQKMGFVLGVANCVENMGHIALRRSEERIAQAAYEDARPLYQQIGDALGEANCMMGQGEIARRDSKHDKAREAYKQALPLYQQVGNALGEANCLFAFGQLALTRSSYSASEVDFGRALTIYRRIGDILGEANCIHNLGDVAIGRSDHGAARTAYEHALRLYRKVAQALGEAQCAKKLESMN